MSKVNPIRRVTAIALILMLGIVDGCNKQQTVPNAQPRASTQNQQANPQQKPARPAPASQPAQDSIPAEQPPGTSIKDVAGGPPEGMFGPDALPGATILTALDPHKMSQSEIQFGVAPKRTADVEYQPDIILMEEGDKAIRSIGSEGMTWKFDANAPHVSEFAEGKIVFATGRAVGRILSLRKDGNTVSVILGPIQLGDVIKNGKFAMSQKIDPNNMISYIAPDFPGAKDNPDEKKTSSREYNDRDLNEQPQESVALSSPTPDGHWQVSSVSQTYANGRRVTYRKIGDTWADPQISLKNVSVSNMLTGYDLIRLETAPPSPQQVTPGLVNKIDQPGWPADLPAARVTGPVPTWNVPDGGIDVKEIATNSGVGLQYYARKQGITISASGLISLHDAGVNFILHMTNGKIDTAGVEMKAAASIKMSFGCITQTDFNTNMSAKHFVPIDISIPLGGGGVPFALTFATSFEFRTGFSARQTIMNADGEYIFSGGVWAGLKGGEWSVAIPTSLKANPDFADSLKGISVGINSFFSSFGIRATVGIGGWGFNTGVFVAVNLTGTITKSPTIGWACKQATVKMTLAAGIGYQIPGWVADAINFFLAPFTGTKVLPVGTVWSTPEKGFFHGDKEIPGGCSSQKTSGG